MTDMHWGELQWEMNPPAVEWDHALAVLSGHPLQSALWGDARQALEGIAQHRWLARRHGEPVWMIRVEERNTLAGKIAWAPRGPTGRTAELSLSIPPGFDEQLKLKGFALLITDPWIQIPSDRNASREKSQTIWLDLSLGKEAIFSNLHNKMRTQIRHAARAGIDVQTTVNSEKITEFVELCVRVSVKKKFVFRTTPAFIQTLLCRSQGNGDAEAVQFVALNNGKLGSGILLFRVGQSVHQMWSGTNREMLQDRVGEACQWAVIEWAIARGCTRYDLEGIDPLNNRPVYEFKKRLGGKEIILHGHSHTPLKLLGWPMSWLIRLGATVRV